MGYGVTQLNEDKNQPARMIARVGSYYMAERLLNLLEQDERENGRGTQFEIVQLDC